MMEAMATSYMLLTVIFGILLLDIEIANGLKCHTCDDCGSIKGQVKECVNIGFKSIIIPRLGSGQQGSLRPPQPGSVSGEQGSRPTPQPGLEPGKSEVEPGFGSGHSELSGEGPGQPEIFDRCIKYVMKDGTISRSCLNKMQEDKLTEFGYKCDNFGSLEGKVCFCSTDLCNEAPKIIGKSKQLLVLNFIASLASHSILNPHF